jgi:hypothetical protein
MSGNAQKQYFELSSIGGGFTPIFEVTGVDLAMGNFRQGVEGSTTCLNNSDNASAVKFPATICDIEKRIRIFTEHNLTCMQVWDNLEEEPDALLYSAQSAIQERTRGSKEYRVSVNRYNVSSTSEAAIFFKFETLLSNYQSITPPSDLTYLRLRKDKKYNIQSGTEQEKQRK